MRWAAVIEAISKVAAADPALVAIYGTAIRMNAGAQDYQMPGLEYQIIADTANELWEPMIVQWDQFTESLADLVDSERALRELFDHAFPVTIEGVFMFSEFSEGAELQSPSRENVFGRAVRFRYTPIRGDLRPGRT